MTMYCYQKKQLDYSDELPGSSKNFQKKMARKCPPRSSRKLNYSDVYSDDDSDIEERCQKVKVNDFVITKIVSTKKKLITTMWGWLSRNSMMNY